MLLLILLLVFAAVTMSSFALLTRQPVELLPSEAFVPVRYESAHAPSGLVRVLYPLLDILAPLFSRLPFT